MYSMREVHEQEGCRVNPTMDEPDDRLVVFEPMRYGPVRRMYPWRAIQKMKYLEELED